MHEDEKNRTWIYHADNKPKLVNVTADEMAELEAEGWELAPVEPNARVEQNDDERDELLERFHEDPEQLNEDELVRLGRFLGVRMMKAWKKDTLINKVHSGLE